MSGDSRQQVWDVFAKAMDTFDKKNADYGDAWRTNGWRGNLSRIFEKVQRVRNLAWRPDPRVPAVGDEQVLETLQDLLNTTAFAIINMIEEVEYGHETPRSQRIEVLGEQFRPGQATTFYDQVSAELPHQPVQLGTHDEPNTTRIDVSQEALEQAQLDGFRVSVDLDQRLALGPDEVRRSESENTGRTRRGQRKPVVDAPQA